MANKQNVLHFVLVGGRNTLSDYTASYFATPNIHTETITNTKTIEFGVEHQETDELPLGEERIVQKGVNGVRTIKTDIRYDKGVEVSRTETSNKVTKEPINQIVEVGTYIAPTIEDVLNVTDEEAYAKAQEFGLEFGEVTAEEIQKLTSSLDIETLNAEFGRLMNKHRESIGVHTLDYQPKYQAGSQLIVDELAEYGNLRVDGESHTRPNGESTITAHGENPDFMAWGENLAMFYMIDNPYQIRSEKYLAEEMFDMWLHSEGHRLNMENEMFDGFSFAIQVGKGEYGDPVIGALTLTTEFPENK